MKGRGCKLADFGGTRKLPHETSVAAGTAATYDYTAPEIKSREPGARPADVWAFGVLLYELCTVSGPAPSNPKDIDQQYSPALRNLIDKCMRPNPEDRPSIL